MDKDLQIVDTLLCFGYVTCYMLLKEVYNE